MDTELKKIKKLVLLMKREGILVIKSKEIEIQLSPVAFDLTPAKQTEDSTKEITNTEQDRDSLLFWSAPGNEGVQ